MHHVIKEGRNRKMLSLIFEVKTKLNLKTEINCVLSQNFVTIFPEQILWSLLFVWIWLFSFSCPFMLACLVHISNYTVDALRTFYNDDDGEKKTLAKLILLSPTLSTRGLNEKNTCSTNMTVQRWATCKIRGDTSHKRCLPVLRIFVFFFAVQHDPEP